VDRESRYRHDALGSAARDVAAVEAARADLERSVARALHWGASWAEIATALGVTRQSAHERYRRLRYDPATGSAWHEPPLPI
jgi:hypothetical protein